MVPIKPFEYHDFFFYFQIGPWLKKKELPTVKMFTSIDARYLKDAKAALNDYLGVGLGSGNLSLAEAFSMNICFSLE